MDNLRRRHKCRFDDDPLGWISNFFLAYSVFGTYVAMAKNRIKRIESAAGGARVVELWGASHFVFLSNEAEVILELKTFGATLK